MRLDERGKECPLPVLEAKKALEASPAGTVVEVIVDNEIAVQNLKKLADRKKLKFTAERVNKGEFVVGIEADGQGKNQVEQVLEEDGPGSVQNGMPDDLKRGQVVVISSDQMGQGDPVLGRLLMKSFLYALTQQNQLPETILLYNGGAHLSCAGSDSLEDLKDLESRGVEILTCGTCLNHYGIQEKLQVGQVTNMYEITERMTQARRLVRP